jgi:hypothetical protein
MFGKAGSSPTEPIYRRLKNIRINGLYHGGLPTTESPRLRSQLSPQDGVLAIIIPANTPPNRLCSSLLPPTLKEEEQCKSGSNSTVRCRDEPGPSVTRNISYSMYPNRGAHSTQACEQLLETSMPGRRSDRPVVSLFLP